MSNQFRIKVANKRLVLEFDIRGMDKKKLRKTGTVTEALPSTHFKVRLDEGEEILCHLAGKLRMFRIKVLPGDRVSVELSPYDEKRGRIVYRGK